MNIGVVIELDGVGDNPCGEPLQVMDIYQQSDLITAITCQHLSGTGPYRIFATGCYIYRPGKIRIRKIGESPPRSIRIEMQAIGINRALVRFGDGIPCREFENHGIGVRGIDSGLSQIEVARKLGVRSVNHAHDQVALDDFVVWKQADNTVTQGDIAVVEPDAAIGTQNRLETSGFLRRNAMHVKSRVRSDPRHDNPIRPAGNMRCSCSQRLVQRTDGRRINEPLGYLVHGGVSIPDVPGCICQQPTEGQQPMTADMERVPALPGKIEREALQHNHSSVRYYRTDVLFPGEGLDLARVSTLSVRRED